MALQRQAPRAEAHRTRQSTIPKPNSPKLEVQGLKALGLVQPQQALEPKPPKPKI